MSEDQKTYQRAVGVSMLGFVVQVAIAVGLLFVWLTTGSPLPQVAMLHAFGGLGIWVCLAIVFQQHKLERIEALEAEQIAKRHGTDTSIFENTADELAVARRRLNWLYKWVVPVVGLATSAYLITAGLLILKRFVGVDEPFKGLILPSQSNAAAVIAAAAAVALVGFLVSRYMAGMAKVEAWKLLRSGAAYLMGSVLMGVLLIVGAALVYFEHAGLANYLIYVMPAIMLIVGVEIVLNFILNLYRPRKVGEQPRPAFDSRILALLTAPESLAKSISEAVNYQFGFEITRSWFWQLLTRHFGWLVLMAFAVLLAVSCLVVVEPNQLAVVTKFGTLREPFLSPGLHFKLPWPIEKTEFYDVEGVRVITIGRDELGELPKRAEDPMNTPQLNERVILWSNKHDEKEPIDLIIAPPADAKIGSVKPGTEEAASDKLPVFLLNADIQVSYRVRPDWLKDYISNNADAAKVEARLSRYHKARDAWTPQQKEADKFKPAFNEHVARLTTIANKVVGRYVLGYTIDEWIGGASAKAAGDLKQAIQQEAHDAKLGVEVTQVVIAGVHPPRTVADAFHAVVGAIHKRQTTIETANQEAIRTLVNAAGSVDKAEKLESLISKRAQLDQAKTPAEELAELNRQIEDLLRQAGGEVATKIAQARAERWAAENSEAGRAEAFIKELTAYRQAPSLYKARAYFKVAREGMKDARKIIIAAERSGLTIREDLKDLNTGALTTVQQEQPK